MIGTFGGRGRGTVLLVDDSRMQRRILRALLERWGFAVYEAGGAAAALEICRATHVDIVISDWMMPGMTGLEFCRAFRDLPRENYGYFIVLTSKSEIGELVHGLEAGADDFLIKPVHANELRARIAGGERVLGMERELNHKNRQLQEALARLNGLYDSLNRDLLEARKLQQSLLRAPFQRFGGAQVSLLLRPSGHVGGDLVGCFPVGETRLGVFCVDVSGHGVTSALMAARLAALFSAGTPEHNIALAPDRSGRFRARPPDEVARAINRLLLQDKDNDIYITLLLAYIHLQSGRLSFVQAGHPPPVVQRRCGEVECLGEGGLPVGLLEEADFECCETILRPGERLLIVSDGVTECADPQGRQVDIAGLARVMRQNAKARGPDFLSRLERTLEDHAAGEPLRDDISAVLLERDAPPA
ncbi:PP2C family protein-serine/threonine phosphatase [Rhodovulum imhoffii]|uniref:PP2C family protein-serine/threonine phosphatase n=1 Tax=Rhodovulum imhoffii TaxID=365340 RepID=UPI002467B314|nr:SpoIIE family protein phosphatase [Rhodovulum imhoffii]